MRHLISAQADCTDNSVEWNGVRIGVFPTYTRVEVQDPLEPGAIIAAVGGMFSFIGLGAPLCGNISSSR